MTRSPKETLHRVRTGTGGEKYKNDNRLNGTTKDIPRY